MTALLRAIHRGESGTTLPELLVGAIVGAMVVASVSTLIFTTNDIQRRADDRSRFAASLALVALAIDRDGAMANPAAPSKSQTSAVDCTTTLDLGFLEAGGPVRFRTVASAVDGPYRLERESGAGTRTIARNVATCTWQAMRDPGGRWALRLDLTLAGTSGETVTHTLRAAPRMW